VLFLYAGFAIYRRLERRPVVHLAATAWAAFALQLFTQDFLAFQLVLPLFVLGVIVLRLLYRRPARSAPLRRIPADGNASPATPLPVAG
jgi:hypothetical protein